jgi:hypothetical protein
VIVQYRNLKANTLYLICSVNYLRNYKDLWEKGREHKAWILFLSTTSAPNIFCSDKQYLLSYTRSIYVMSYVHFCPFKKGGERKPEKTRQQFFPNSGTLHPDKELMPVSGIWTHLLVWGWRVTAWARELKSGPERKMPLLTQKLGILHRWGTTSPHWCHSGTADTEITDKALLTLNLSTPYVI